MSDGDAWLAGVNGQAYAKFVAGHRTAVVDFDTDSENMETDISKVLREAPLAEANSVSSLHLSSKLHRPMLDIDMPAMLVPSTTPNHSHLYLDHLMTWYDYEKLLRCLGTVGIIQQGFMHASIDREASWVRTPWTKKGT